MSAGRGRARKTRRQAAIRRRRIAATLAAVAIVVFVGVIASAGGGGVHRSSPRFVRVKLEGRIVATRRVADLRTPPSIAKLLAHVPATRAVRRGAATLELRTERARLARALERAAATGGGTVAVLQRPIASAIRVPLIRQVLRDDCEATALSMVLAYRGVKVGQLALQDQVAHSPPLDPTVSSGGVEVWGDPSRGFVGRADGGGSAGGFGVYQRPVAALARRHGVLLRDLTGASPADLYDALLGGHPVLAWVALSEGPYATWQTPAGRVVRVNFGEHAVVLTGADQGSISVNDPLSGQRLTWSKPQFERMWTALGRRALAA